MDKQQTVTKMKKEDTTSMNKYLAHRVGDDFPRTRLRALCSDKVGQRGTDYGGYEATLRFDREKEGVGKYTVGAYNSGSREKGNINKKLELPWLTRETLTTIGWKYYHSAMGSLRYALRTDRRLVKMRTMIDDEVFENSTRVEALRGARTLPHTDTARGCQPSFVMFHDKRGGIRQRVWPHFKASVVTLMGRRYIPVGYGAYGLHLYAMDPNDETRAIRVECSGELLYRLKPHGLLQEYMVLGIKGGKVQIMRYQQVGTMESVSTVEKISIGKVFEEAEKCVDDTYPAQGRKWHRTFREPHCWHPFYSWRFIHEWHSACDSMCRRTHIFFRAVREQSSGSNFVRTGHVNYYVLQETSSEAGETHELRKVEAHENI